MDHPINHFQRDHHHHHLQKDHLISIRMVIITTIIMAITTITRMVIIIIIRMATTTDSYLSVNWDLNYNSIEFSSTTIIAYSSTASQLHSSPIFCSKPTH